MRPSRNKLAIHGQPGNGHGCDNVVPLLGTLSQGCGSSGVSCRFGVAGGCLHVREASVPMVLKCEIGTAEGKPQVEEYGLDELAASADAVMAGMGPLAAGLARLALGAGRVVTVAEMELLASEQGREILRGVLQLSRDRQAAAEVRRAGVTGADE